MSFELFESMCAPSAHTMTVASSCPPSCWLEWATVLPATTCSLRTRLTRYVRTCTPPHNIHLAVAGERRGEKAWLRKTESEQLMLELHTNEGQPVLWHGGIYRWAHTVPLPPVLQDGSALLSLELLSVVMQVALHREALHWILHNGQALSTCANIRG